MFKRPPFVFKLISLLSAKDKIFNAIAAATAPVPQERVSSSTPLSYVLIWNELSLFLLIKLTLTPS